MLFIGYIFGIRSERQLVKEIQVNMVYCWFIGFGIKDKIPDSFTISQNRRRHFNGTTIAQDIFDNIVLQAMKRKMIEGRTLYTDSTHLKANANKHKFASKIVQKTTRTYLSELDDAVEEDRKNYGKKLIISMIQKQIVTYTQKGKSFIIKRLTGKAFGTMYHVRIFVKSVSFYLSVPQTKNA